MSVIPDQPVIPDCSSAPLPRLGVYKDLEVPGRAGKIGSVNLLPRKISSAVVHGRIRIETKRKTALIVGIVSSCFLKSSHFGSVLG